MSEIINRPPDFQDRDAVKASDTRLNKKVPKRVIAAPSLRPPTLMIDLLFGALMLFAFQMGDPNSTSIVSKEFKIPTATKGKSAKSKILFPIRPIRNGRLDWMYETEKGKRVSAKEVAEIIRSQKSTAVLLVPSDALVQQYIDAEQPLRALGVQPGLAVSPKKGEDK